MECIFIDARQGSNYKVARINAKGTYSTVEMFILGP